MSSKAILKTVSKKLKYYIEVQRLEDGFDLSGSECPRLDHPPTKARPTLMYDGLHDRPLKHYFSPQEVKVQLTQFKANPDSGARQKKVKKSIERNMMHYRFLNTPMILSTDLPPWQLYDPPPPRRKDTAPLKKNQYCPRKDLPHSQTKPPVLAAQYYTSDGRGGRKLRKDATGFGVPLRKRKSPHRGGYPILRCTPHSLLTRGEARRLVNHASQLLVATETIDLKEGKEGERAQSAPRSFETDGRHPRVSGRESPAASHGRSKKQSQYVYDIHGRRVPAQRKKKSARSQSDDEDSAYETPDSSNPHGGNYMTIEKDKKTGKPVPQWLKKEMKKADVNKEEEKGYVRSVSPKPPLEPRPVSSKSQSSRSSRSSSRSSSSYSSGSKSSRSLKEGGTQTGGELLKKYEPMESPVIEGEKITYKIHIHTGDRMGAGTQASIRVTLFGDRGKSPDVFLKDSTVHKIPFQRSMEDIFVIETLYVGQLRKVLIGHDSTKLGHGWYLEKMEVKEVASKVLYIIPCQKWMSSREGDTKTLRTLEVDAMTTYEEVEEETADYTPVDKNLVTVKYEKASTVTDSGSGKAVNSDAASASHTSLDTNYESQKNGKKAVDLSSSSSSYTTTATSSESGSGGEEEEEEKKDDVTMRISMPPALPPRKDDFFDQTPAGRDYSSVIGSLSTTTDQDNKDDFESDKPQYSARDLGKGPIIYEMKRADDSDDSERAVLKVESQPRISEKLHMDDDAAQPSTTASKKESKKESSSEPEEEIVVDEKANLMAKGPTIHQASATGNLVRVTELCAAFPELKIAKDERGYTVLHAAAEKGQLEVIKWLTVTLTDLDTETSTGYTAMHLCAMHGHTDSMMVLHAMGARVDAKSMDQQTPLHVAAMSGQLSSVCWLVTCQADDLALDLMQRTPLDIAESYKHTDVVKFLGSLRKQEVKEESDHEDPVERPKTAMARGRMYVSDSDSSDSDSSSSTPHTSSDEEQKEDAVQKEKEEENPVPASNYSAGVNASSEDEAPFGKGGEAVVDEEDELDTFLRNKKDQKQHDTELMEKRKLYNRQRERQESQGTTFLDSIRAESSTGREEWNDF